MTAPMSLFNVPDEVLETVTSALVRGVRSIDPDDGQLSPLAVVVRDGHLRVHRPLGDGAQARMVRARELLRGATGEILVLVYAGTLHHHLVRTQAVYAQAQRAGDDHSVLFAQRTRGGPHGPEAEGSPVFLGAVEPLAGAPSRSAGATVVARDRQRRQRGWRRLRET